MASPPRKAIRLQMALVFGGGLLLCLFPAVVTGGVQLGFAIHDQRVSPGLVRDLAWLMALGAIAAWLVAAWMADRVLGPTLDRLHETARTAAEVEFPHEIEGLRLESAHLTSAFGQLVGRMVEANQALRAQVNRLAALNRELQSAREELLRAERLATLGRLAAGVAHEIGNPLGALLGYVDVAKADPSAQGEALRGIGTEALRIHRTLQELMDFARPGKIEVAAVRLSVAIDAAVRLVRAHPRWRSMDLAVTLPPGVPPVQASEHHLVQVLVNLLLNAADACEGRGHVSIAADVPGPSEVTLRVLDDGPGLPAGSEAHVFEPFFTTKREGHGTGLGLAICRQLMESFGGGIWAESPAVSDRSGAVFRLVFRVPSAFGATVGTPA
jgi:two-component system NtrC family sensor kinase